LCITFDKGLDKVSKGIIIGIDNKNMEKPKYKQISVAELYKIIDYQDKGLTLREIGNAIGMSAEGVRLVIKKFRLKTGKTIQKQKSKK
jgi:DNA-binding transcriptional regulator GbsR (MarR family)